MVFESFLWRNTTEFASFCDLPRQVDLAVTGQIALGWTVTRGAARDVVTLTNTTGDTGLATCISKRVREWDFATAGDGTARVTWDLHAAPMTQLSPSMKLGQVVGPPTAELVVKSNRGSLLFCHESSLESHPGLAGSLTARWNIQDGLVGDVQVDSHLDESLVACAVNKIRRWRFTGLADGPIQATFEFKPKAPEAEIMVAEVAFEPK